MKRRTITLCLHANEVPRGDCPCPPACECRAAMCAPKKRKRTPPGSRWRVLAHHNGEAVRLENAGVFDELVVSPWLHLEKMSRDLWWLRLGEHGFDITVDADGKAEVFMRAAGKMLSEIAPGDYA